MDENPILTVITPTHNIIDAELSDAFNLLVTLLSKQTYPNIEHLIIDKASTDGTVQLLSDYKSKGYLQFFSESDSGRFDALNKGIMRARGKYVTFLNCDDFIHDITSLNEIVEILEENNFDYTFAPSYCIHPEGYVFPFQPAILNIFQVMPCAMQAMVFKKSMLSAENFFDLKFKHMADFDLVMRLVLKDYSGIYYEKNYVTSKLNSKIFTNTNIVENECKQIYIKNMRNLYPLTEEIVDKMFRYSDFPKELLEKLSLHFPPENKEDFINACERMRMIRTEAQKNLEEQNN